MKALTTTDEMQYGGDGEYSGLNSIVARRFALAVFAACFETIPEGQKKIASKIELLKDKNMPAIRRDYYVRNIRMSQNEIKENLDWLSGRSASLLYWCDVADLSPRVVNERAREIKIEMEKSHDNI